MFLIALALLSADVPPSPPPTLAYFVGVWRCDGNLLPSGRPISSTLAFTWDAETASLVKAHADLPPGKYKAAERWAYTPETKAFRASVSSVAGGIRWYSTPGWMAEVLTWRKTRAEGERDDAFAYRRIGPDEMQIEWSVDRTGSGLEPGDKLVCRRKV